MNIPTALAGWRLYALAAVGGAAIVGGVVTAWVVHGNSRYDDGYAAAQDAARVAAAAVDADYRKHEQDLQTQADAKLIEAQKNAQIASAAAVAASARVDSLQRTIATQRAAAAANAQRAGTNVGAASAPWDVLSACIDRYRQLGKDADAIIEQYRPVISWASVIDPTGAALAGWSDSGQRQ